MDPSHAMFLRNGTFGFLSSESTPMEGIINFMNIYQLDV